MSDWIKLIVAIIVALGSSAALWIWADEMTGGAKANAPSGWWLVLFIVAIIAFLGSLYVLRQLMAGSSVSWICGIAMALFVIAILIQYPWEALTSALLGSVTGLFAGLLFLVFGQLQSWQDVFGIALYGMIILGTGIPLVKWRHSRPPRSGLGL